MSLLNIYYTDNLEWLKRQSEGKYSLIYIDPPFNTGRKQIRGNDGTHYGYDDTFEDFIGFIQPRIEQAYRILKNNGSFFFHLDYREIHYCKVEIDKIFGRDCFQNEIIWAYEWGSKSTKRWSAKHDTILWYTKNPNEYTFNYDAIDRLPYKTTATGLVSLDKQKKGKTMTDCWDDTQSDNLIGDYWWNTVVPTNSKEKNGYATQKPLKILERIVRVHSNENDQCLDFFAGSGSFGEACLKLNRNCDLVDRNPDAISVMKKRFEQYKLMNDIKFHNTSL